MRGIIAGFNHAAHALDSRADARLQRRILADSRLSLGKRMNGIEKEEVERSQLTQAKLTLVG
jgi:hypothetical protein